MTQCVCVGVGVGVGVCVCVCVEPKFYSDNIDKIITIFPQKTMKYIGKSKGVLVTTPPLGPISFIFMYFLAKILSNNGFKPSPRKLAPQPHL